MECSHIWSRRGLEKLASAWLWARGVNVCCGWCLSDGLRPALLGLGIGIVLSLGVARLIGSVLYGTSPLDPSVFVSVVATLLISATVACLLPAWRAAHIDPMCALRAE
jgi:putative ABC transport system permease protein